MRHFRCIKPVFETAGQTALCEKSLALNPDSATGKEALKSIQEGATAM
jgi:hypothetical protein